MHGAREAIRCRWRLSDLHLAKLTPPGGERGQWPVHGFVITHPGGAVLVDTGVGGPEDLLSDWRVVNVAAADALAELDMSPADISLVINTHLHFDHCGQNAVFKHAPFYVQRAELDRARRESPDLSELVRLHGRAVRTESPSARRADALCQFRLTNQGCQSILTGMDIEELSVNLSSDDPAIGLRASLALHRLAERVEANHVASAREKGWSWQQIGDALGVTRQSVHTKYNKESS